MKRTTLLGAAIVLVVSAPIALFLRNATSQGQIRLNQEAEPEVVCGQVRSASSYGTIIYFQIVTSKYNRIHALQELRDIAASDDSVSLGEDAVKIGDVSVKVHACLPDTSFSDLVKTD